MIEALLHALILAPFVAPGAVLAFYIIDHRRVTGRRREFPREPNRSQRLANERNDRLRK